VLRAKSVRRLSVCCIPKPLAIYYFAPLLFSTVGDKPYCYYSGHLLFGSIGLVINP